SDARLLRGLLAALLARVDGLGGEELAQLDVAEWFDQLGLSRQLSPSRSNGMNAVLQRMRELTRSKGGRRCSGRHGAPGRRDGGQENVVLRRGVGACRIGGREIRRLPYVFRPGNAQPECRAGWSTQRVGHRTEHRAAAPTLPP